MEVLPDLVRKLVVKRTGVGSFVLDPDFVQILDDDVALDFQFAGYFIDAYLSHACFFSLSLAFTQNPIANQFWTLTTKACRLLPFTSLFGL